MTATLRPVTDADAPVLLELFASTRAGEFAALPARTRELVMRQQQSARLTTWRTTHGDALEDRAVIDEGGQVVGRLIIACGREGLRLIDITLLPPSRGRGIGTSLIAELQERAAARGAAVRLHVEHANPGARRLYARLGFAADGGDELREALVWWPS